MESELEVLRQRITELEAENAELRVIKQRNAELEAKLELWKQRVNLHEEKIAELKAKSGDLVVENFELKHEIMKFRSRIETILLPKRR
ncbi:hypothetical protein RirG_101550 [Rhizophagus irregularis DAOM 197198w]|uniref:Uncharacterized protein n=1 Tax=Rhizophagus irregularis (strain DAOM 197198w) TaxID=1432141 RepID=A0A015KMS4_RHIIW|nr:hypothetical protein RirG_101480 [Rhizophagus irregularis DAOM 197198w]EXX68836.1 hypothetical protein RirG_101550 [Rhizophagus irregularis DAOM 197198w]